MDSNWLQSLIYGLVSGFTEFVPVSARAHESLLLWLFGAEKQLLLQVFVKLGALAGLLTSCHSALLRFRRERRIMRLPRKRRKRQPDASVRMDMKFLKIAAIPMLLLLLFRIKTSQLDQNMSLLPIFLILNGIVLFIPDRLASGNKDSSSLSPLDGFLMGLFAGISAVPGISRMGLLTTVASARGTDRQHGLNMALLLSIPALVLLLIFDVVGVATTVITGVTFLVILQCIVAAVAAWLGASLAIMVLRFLAVKTGFSGFAYYSWGVALFVFLMFLTT